MKTILIFVTLMFVASAYGGATQPAEKPGAGTQSDLENEVEIRKLYAGFTEAWNRHDARSMAQIWALEGDHYEPDGRSAEGRDAVELLFREEQATAFKDSKLTLTVDTVWFITPNVALVNGSYQIDGVRAPGGREISIRKGHLTSVLLKEQGRWWVAASRAMIPGPLIWRQR